MGVLDQPDGAARPARGGSTGPVPETNPLQVPTGWTNEVRWLDRAIETSCGGVGFSEGRGLPERVIEADASSAHINVEQYRALVLANSDEGPIDQRGPGAERLAPRQHKLGAARPCLAQGELESSVLRRPHPVERAGLRRSASLVEHGHRVGVGLGHAGERQVSTAELQKLGPTLGAAAGARRCQIQLTVGKGPAQRSFERRVAGGGGGAHRRWFCPFKA